MRGKETQVLEHTGRFRICGVWRYKGHEQQSQGIRNKSKYRDCIHTVHAETKLNQGVILSSEEKGRKRKNILESATVLRNKITAKNVTRRVRILEIIDNR